MPPPAQPVASNILEPSPSSIKPIPITPGLKVFINVAVDDGVPPPPKSSEHDIRKAMAGDDNNYFVPVIVSDGREVKDKAGKLSLVFDTIFHPSIRARANADADFKTYITEIALERVEGKSGLTLGREIASPNIKSKGALGPRSVLVPSYWSPESKSTPLIQEITPLTSQKTLPATTSILMSSPSSPGPASPKWERTLERSGTSSRVVKITIQLPGTVRSDYDQMTLDVESNRLIFNCPPSYALLDIPILDSISSETVPRERTGTNGSSPLKTSLRVDMNLVKAEWRVRERVLIVSAPVLLAT